MSNMHELTLFVGIIPRRGFFLFDIAPTREIEWPYRVCKHSLLTKIWPGKALVTGKWSWSGLGEEQALLAAVEGEKIGSIEELQSRKEERLLVGD